MTEKEHREHHARLHKCLDELIDCYIHQTGRMASETTVMQLKRWSLLQTETIKEIEPVKSIIVHGK